MMKVTFQGTELTIESIKEYNPMARFAQMRET
jgi:hypothetical protein